MPSFLTSRRRITFASVGICILATIIFFVHHLTHRPANVTLREESLEKINDVGTSALEPSSVVIVPDSIPAKIKTIPRATTLRRSSDAATYIVELSTALDGQNDLPLVSRLSTVRTYGQGIARSDWEAIRDFVRSAEGIDGLNAEQLRYLKNEAMSALIRAGIWLDEAGEAFKSVYADEQQDLGIRDYALQFIAVAAEKDTRVSWSIHWQVLESNNKDFACTAATHLLAASTRGELSQTEQARLGKAALNIASSKGISAANRATALQVCAELGIREASELADEVIRNENEPLVARLSAIATLGRLGGPAQSEAHLRLLTTSSDKRLRAAASAALVKFTANVAE